jgi:hypothetical protein
VILKTERETLMAAARATASEPGVYQRSPNDQPVATHWKTGKNGRRKYTKKISVNVLNQLEHTKHLQRWPGPFGLGIQWLCTSKGKAALREDV